MALQKSYADSFGVTHSEAYFKISAIEHSRNSSGNSAVIRIECFHSAASRNTTPPKSVLASYLYTIVGSDYNTYFDLSILDVANSNEFKQGYAFLKAHTPDQTRNELDFTTGTTDV